MDERRSIVVRRVLITGVSSGIGKAIKPRLGADGWQVVGLTHDEVDLSDLSAVAEKAQELRDKLKSVDALVHIAGLWHDKDELLASKKLEKFDWRQIADTMNVGLTSFMILIAELLPILAKDGAVIGISGTFSDGAAGWLPYYTSKRALEDFLVGLAQDYPDGPRVFGVSPADTSTAAYRKFYPEYAAFAQPPEAVAELVAKLVEGAAEYKSGDVIQIRDSNDSFGYHQ